MRELDELPSSSRRTFLTKTGMAGAAALAAGSLSLEPLFDKAPLAQDPSIFRDKRRLDDDVNKDISTSGDRRHDEALTGRRRVVRAYEIRVDAARRERNAHLPAQTDNRDEVRYENKIASFTKGLRHNSIGEVDQNAYAHLVAAIQSGQFSDFENLRVFLGCPDPTKQRPLVNPESAYAFDLEGADSSQLTIPAAPKFASAEEAGEMVELYWMSLLRDVNFEDYAQSTLAQEAADDISRLSDFRGPTENGRVTTQTLFRDSFPGCTTGPYISQFLLRQTAIGAQRIDQRIGARAAGSDYMTSLGDWLNIQNGCAPNSLAIPPDTSIPTRFIRNGRDIAQYVRLDVLNQAFYIAALILINGITLNETTSPFVFRFPFDAGNPYGARGSTFTQAAFGTFGNPHIMTLVTEASTRALKAVWYQKWLVHRRLRPEEFGGRVEIARQNLAQYPIHTDLTLRSSVLARIINQFGSYLLPQAYPEGSPLHPSYGSGHAVIAGACVTMLKAFFDETTVIREPIRINSADGGQTIIPYDGPDLTVGGELNKLASNVATGRNIAGIHWRSDAVEGMILGEAVAISILNDMRETYNEPFSGFSLTKFDGTTIIVGGESGDDQN